MHIQLPCISNKTVVDRLKMEEKYDVFIAGGGLGGLLSSALLSRKGKKCYLVEKLPYLGGRFTTHKFEGFEIPTGAVHMIPHSRNGLLGKTLLNELTLPITIKDTENFTTWYWNNKDPHSHSLHRQRGQCHQNLSNPIIQSNHRYHHLSFLLNHQIDRQ